MHVGMVHFSGNRSFPPDIRVEKEISALVGASMRVSVLCPQTRPEEPFEETIPSGAQVFRRPIAAASKGRLAWENWTLRLRRYEPALAEFVARVAPDVLHVHDLPLVPTVLAMARPRRIPVVADFHENTPAMVRASRSGLPWGPRLRQWWGAPDWPLRWHERRVATACRRVIVVVPEAIERFFARGMPPDRFVVVSNTEDETTLRTGGPSLDESLAAGYAKRLVACYVGGAEPERGLETVVRALPRVVAQVPSLLLLVAGANDHQRRTLEMLAAARGVAGHVEVHGWEPFERCLQYMLLSRFCLVPYANCEHTQTTVPSKLFQYMACARAVLASDCRPLKRIVEAARAGVVFEADDPGDCAKAMLRLAQDEDLCRQCGANGQRAAFGEFAWRRDAARLVAMYAELAAELEKN